MAAKIPETVAEAFTMYEEVVRDFDRLAVLVQEAYPLVCDLRDGEKRRRGLALLSAAVDLSEPRG